MGYVDDFYITCKGSWYIKDFGYSGWLGILYCAGSNLTAKKQEKELWQMKKKITYTCAYGASS